MDLTPHPLLPTHAFTTPLEVEVMVRVRVRVRVG